MATNTSLLRLALILATLLVIPLAPVTADPALTELAAPAATYIRYVDADAAGGDGTSWATAYHYLQDALDAANGDSANDYEIWVAEGVYTPDKDSDGGHTNGDRAESFTLHYDNVRLYGGFAGTEATREERDWEAHVTVLSGDIGQDDTTGLHGVVTTTAHISGTNAYHVLWLDGATYEPISTTTVIDGFAITAGQADSTAPHDQGGGFYCLGSGSGGACSPTLSHITFSGNHAVQGGGMFNYGLDGGVSSPTLTDVIFSGNQTAGHGAGMLNFGFNGGVNSPVLTNVTFSGNQASAAGGGMYNAGVNGSSSPVLIDVTFIGNQAAGGGGGMVNNGTSGACSPVLTRVTFSGNQSGGEGGGGMVNVGVNGGTSSPVLTDVAFRGNWTDGDGGGMYNYIYSSGTSSPVLTNVIFSGNRAGGGGGGMANNGSSGTSSPVLTNVTFSGNWAASGGGIYNYGLNGSSNPLLTNVILWGNSGSQMHNSYASPTLNYSLVQDGCPYGAICDAHLLTSDPQFVAPVAATATPTTTGDYRLLGASPAIDAGNNLSVTVPTDLDGNPRMRDGDGDGTATVDLGAYEFQILYVDADAITGADDGTSWDDAYLHLQDALDETNADGTVDFEIWVAAAVYYPDEDSDGDHVSDAVAETFTLHHDNVRLYGGFDPQSGVGTWDTRDWQSHVTVLSGDIGQDDTADANGVITTTNHISGTNAYHVLWLDGVTNEPISTTTVIDGFAITAGQADGTTPHNDGGGLYCDGSNNGHACSPTLAHLAFSGNYAQSSGGGLVNNGRFGGASSPALTDVTFNGNQASEGNGGGMFNDAGYSGTSNPSLTDVTFNANQAGWGGGMLNSGASGGVSNPTLTNVTFSGNQATTWGGGMCNGGVSSPVLTDVTFSNNQAAVGGGMYNYGWQGNSSPVLTNVTFSGNQASWDGGGMVNNGGRGNSSPVLTNVTFSGNQAGFNGGGMVNDGWQGNSSPLLTNVTFSGNQAGGDGGGMYNDGFDGTSNPTLTNVILWSNGATSGAVMFNRVATPTIAYSLVEGGIGGSGIYNDGGSVIDGGGNIAVDPQFVAPIAATAAPTTTGDYRLLGSSPSIDAGNNAAITVTTDLDGNPRFLDHPRSDSGSGTPPIVDMGAYETPNSPPQANANGPYSGDEGSSIALDGTGSSDIDTDDVLTYEWDCTDDGSYDTSSLNPDDRSCTYPDNGTYATRLRVTDSQGLTDTITATVAISNVAPALSGLAPVDVDEGSVLTLTGAIVDPGTQDTFTVTVDWDDGSAPEIVTYPAGTTGFTQTHTYLDDDPTATPSDFYTVTLTLEDDDGGGDVESITVTVDNVVPILSGLVATDVDENGVTTLNGTIVDPGVQDTFTMTVDWGDGGALAVLAYPAGTTSFTQTHQYLDDDPTATPSDLYTITLTVEDDDGGVDVEPTTLTVSNVAPLVEAGPNVLVEAGEPVTFTGAFTDVGTLDTHTIEWDFGDGEIVTGTLTPVHIFAVGTHTVTLTVSDDDGGVGEDEVVVTMERWRVYLPLVMRTYAVAPDLGVEEPAATPDGVEVVVRNQGNPPTTDDSWSDVTIDPHDGHPVAQRPGR